MPLPLEIELHRITRQEAEAKLAKQYLGSFIFRTSERKIGAFVCSSIIAKDNFDHRAISYENKLAYIQKFFENFFQHKRNVYFNAHSPNDEEKFSLFLQYSPLPIFKKNADLNVDIHCADDLGCVTFYAKFVLQKIITLFRSSRAKEIIVDSVDNEYTLYHKIHRYNYELFKSLDKIEYLIQKNKINSAIENMDPHSDKFVSESRELVNLEEKMKENIRMLSPKNKHEYTNERHDYELLKKYSKTFLNVQKQICKMTTASMFFATPPYHLTKDIGSLIGESLDYEAACNMKKTCTAAAYLK